MRTAGILTLHGGYNFGAALQAFALQRTIAGLGHSCTIIDFRERRPNSEHQLFHSPHNRNGVVHDVKVLMHLRSHLALRKRFAKFRAYHMTLTAESYGSLDELAGEDSAFDTYVSGSDQVWHPYLLNRQSGPVFYLDFIASGRRVAYAPSFGLPEIPAPYRDRAAGFMRRFDFLSARENTGCSIIRELAGRAAEHVLDPTFLQPVSEYDRIAVEPSLSEPYILLYPMLWSDRLWSLVSGVRKCLKLPIVAVLPSHFRPEKFTFVDKVVFDAGPAEFLGWMKNAAFVCTNSFHGTCFSIIYRKSFLGAPNSASNTRLLSLFERLGLCSRQVADTEAISPGDPLLGPLDYLSAEARLQQAIDQSLDYLKRALA